MEPPSSAPEVSTLETQIADLNRDLDRRLGEIRHLQAHIDDLTQDRGNLESTIHHLASEMSQAGGEILDLQQANRDLDRSREDAESTLSATEESLRRTRSELDRVEAELLLSRSDRTDRGSSGPDLQPQPADPQPTGPTQADLDQIRTLSRDLGKVVRERDALRHEYTAAFQRLTSISATIGAPPPQTQLRLEPGSDTDQPAGGIPRSPSAETSGSADQDADAPRSKRPRSRSASPSPSLPQKKRSVPVEVDDGSVEEEDASEFDLGGGSTGGGSPSPDQAASPPSKDADCRKPTGEVIEVGSASNEEEEEEEEENAEVADDLYEPQTLMTISQSRSEARRRDHASPQSQLAGGSPGGFHGSNSDTGSGDQGNGSGPTDWIFHHRPTIYTSPMAPAFCGHLITEANVKALQVAEPTVISKQYWESTHKFPITAAMIAQSPWLGSFAKQRNNRRSHAGNRWKRMLLTLIQAMIEGWWDLDLLLDPLFLHFPNTPMKSLGIPGSKLDVQIWLTRSLIAGNRLIC
ncbi:Hypothetical protein PHPALM_17909 [Phytophthora palmivora]|uniref:Uncharacterized protein n=1 Tax=Phytophthora palmivora TaxID=4796 RepID=A0A2P4XL25_9STRA|nr:Hypothetical protein PHPALM_17909 [Phytophthora palmivora]